MSRPESATLHDAYATTYDADVQAYDCHIAEVLFGLCYDAIRPGQRLLDAGIGSGLSAELFARAGLAVHGMDFSLVMLELCRAKGFAAGLKQHDVLDLPWPFPSGWFDHLVCCGVLHFIADLEGIFGEAGRVLRNGGLFAFTTRVPTAPVDSLQKYERQAAGGFELYSHASRYVDALLTSNCFTRLKTQRCFVGEDLFTVWVASSRAMPA